MEFDEVSHIQKTQGIVGRREELRKAFAALSAGKHLLIEGTVGVGKTILATAVTKHLGRPFVRVDGDERYTEQKLVGWFDPPLVMKGGYTRDAFLEGPLVSAMNSGGVIFINELNRMPEGVQNVLLPAMDERRIEIPKIGTVEAKDGFAVVATQNPREFVATSTLSEALRDRFELLTLDYQSEDEEKMIVQRNVETQDQSLIDLIVQIARKTRTHPEVKRGASVRAAMSTVQICLRLNGALQEVVHEAASMALPTRIEMKDDAKSTAQEVIAEIVDACLKNARLLGKEQQPLSSASSESHGNPDSTTSFTETIDPMERLREILGLEIKSQDDIGQAVARNYASLKTSIKDPKLLEYAKRLALRAIVRRVISLLGPARIPTKMSRVPFLPGVEGELDIEETTERILGEEATRSEDLVLETKRPKRVACSLMLDSSLSMTGDKLAVAAASMAVLAGKMKTFDYALIAFSNSAIILKGLRQASHVASLLEKMLDANAWGYTNIEDALKKGLDELQKARSTHKLGIIITDGNYTAGGDPVKMASLYPKLHVVMIEDYDSKQSLCQEMSSVGKGKFFSVKDFDDLPRVLYKILRSV